MKTYQVTQNLDWACPGMLVFVVDGRIIGHQQNPANGATQSWAEDGTDWGPFDPSNYKECKLVI